MNGIELANEICAIRAGIKVVLMSGYTDTSMTAQGMITETTGFLQKPFTSQTLRAKLRQALGC